MYDIKMLKAKKIAELIEIAEQIGIKNLKGQKKQDIIDTIVGKSISKKPTEVESESDKKSTEVKSESDKKPIHTKSESDKKPIHAKSESDNSNKPYRNDRNPRNSGNKNHHNNLHQLVVHKFRPEWNPLDQTSHKVD